MPVMTTARLVVLVALWTTLAWPAAASTDPAEAHRRLEAVQTTLDSLTAPAARLYALFVETRHHVQRARIGTHPTPRMLRRFTRSVADHRVPSAADPARRALALAMFEHEIVKEVLARQNAFIQNALHEAGHVLAPIVAGLRRTGRVDEWFAVWPQSAGAGPLAVCPVAGPHSLYDTFGAPRPGGRRHEGDDILAPEWTPIVAPADGDVVPNPNTLGGNALLEYTPPARMYFAHLVAYGATGHVRAGTVIGYVGNSGDARGLPFHLHFQYEPGGAPVDPYPYLRGVC
jgi:murein DD-endopeptidase MepM/ murein hydrolase activator NlpD